MQTIAMCVGLLIVSLLTHSAILWVSARLVRAGSPSFRRTVASILLLSTVNLIVLVIVAAIPIASAITMIIVWVVQIAAVLLVTWRVFARFLRITYLRSMLVSVPYFAVSIPIALLTVFVTKTYCMEAFIIPTN